MLDDGELVMVTAGIPGGVGLPREPYGDQEIAPVTVNGTPELTSAAGPDGAIQVGDAHGPILKELVEVPALSVALMVKVSDWRSCQGDMS